MKFMFRQSKHLVYNLVRRTISCSKGLSKVQAHSWLIVAVLSSLVRLIVKRRFITSEC